jgi:hypothetical protein
VHGHGQVVGQGGDLVHFDPGSRADFEGGDLGPPRDIDQLAFHAEIAELGHQHGAHLLQLLARNHLLTLRYRVEKLDRR